MVSNLQGPELSLGEELADMREFTITENLDKRNEFSIERYLRIFDDWPRELITAALQEKSNSLKNLNGRTICLHMNAF